MYLKTLKVIFHKCKWYFVIVCRCEQTLFNAPGEALALTDAARLFLASEQETRALRAPGFDENMQAAMNCYSFAIKVNLSSLFQFISKISTSVQIYTFSKLFIGR